MRSKNSKLKLKRKYCFILGILFTITMQYATDFIITNINNYFEKCDKHYGYTTDYYSCRQYHLNKK